MAMTLRLVPLNLTVTVAAAFSLLATSAKAAEAPRAGVEAEHPTWQNYMPRPRSRAERLATCMALWEPATHMTKSDWKRTCDRVEAPD